MRALERDPDRRYQTMGQLEYDLVKSLFGRVRAVSELLGLRDAESRRTPVVLEVVGPADPQEPARSRRCRGRRQSRTRRKRPWARPRDGPTTGREAGRERRRPGQRPCGHRPESGPARWS